MDRIEPYIGMPIILGDSDMQMSAGTDGQMHTQTMQGQSDMPQARIVPQAGAAMQSNQAMQAGAAVQSSQAMQSGAGGSTQSGQAMNAGAAMQQAQAMQSGAAMPQNQMMQSGAAVQSSQMNGGQTAQGGTGTTVQTQQCQQCLTDENCGTCPRPPQQTMVPAMAYVPWQIWQQPYDYEKGFEVGTIFPDLDLPFLGYQGGRRR